jgi:hypothetical protein
LYSTTKFVELVTKFGVEVTSVVLHPRRGMTVARNHHDVSHHNPPSRPDDRINTASLFGEKTSLPQTLE